jgi:hypothetical protein
MHRIAIVMPALLLAGATAALAQFPPQPPPPTQPGSAQDRAACHPDVVRFCRTELDRNKDDIFGILACLQRNRTRISVACRRVLAENGQ